MHYCYLRVGEDKGTVKVTRLGAIYYNSNFVGLDLLGIVRDNYYLMQGEIVEVISRGINVVTIACPM